MSEERIVLRMLTDLSVVTAGFKIGDTVSRTIGFTSVDQNNEVTLNFNALQSVFNNTPGLASDKLKTVLEFTWSVIKNKNIRGITFAYDEAQNISDHADKNEFPTALLLDVFQSLQKKGIPFMLALVGLPTLFPKLVESRTFAERMFRVVTLDKLSKPDSRDAIRKPIKEGQCPLILADHAVDSIVELSGGYPYFIQFICREVYDAFIAGQKSVPVAEITRKLDSDFFAGRWARATDRQRDLLIVIARLPNAGTEFSVQEIATLAAQLLQKPFGASHISQMLAALGNEGLIYKNRHAKYSFAVPLLDQFIKRQITEAGR